MPGTKDYESTAKGIDESLHKIGLGTGEALAICNVMLSTDYLPDYVDLFLIHDPMPGPEQRMSKYRALLDAKKAGKIRTVGVSN
jgi:diketogulonate reductase-like aldo/keto reductase